MSDPIYSLGNFQSLSKGSLISNLNELGTQLRDANVRSSAYQFIPTLIQITNESYKNFKETNDVTILLEAFRVFVNLTADNDSNRDFLATLQTDDLSKFWQNIVGSFDLVVDDLLCQRIMLFLPQFIHSTEKLDEFLKFFGHIGLTNGLINYLDYSNDQQFEDIEDMYDHFISILEILSNTSSVIKPNEFYGKDQELAQLLIILQTCSKLLQPFNYPEQEAPEAFGEVLDYLSKLCYNITLLDDSQAFRDSNVHEILLNLLQLLPKDGAENITTIKRRFFSTSGNITSMPSYNNEKDIRLNLSIILSTYDKFESSKSDSYTASAAAIGLGNFIISKENQTVVLNSITDLTEFLILFFNIGFIDLIQYQALHLLSNLTNDRVSYIILTNLTIHERLLQFTKVIIDNSKYYKEVSQIYFKFLKKLIRWGFIESSTQGQLNIYDFVAIWQYLNNNETKSEVSEIDFLLLQGLLKDISLFKDSNLTRDNYTFFGELLTNAITDTNANSNVSITFILEKLKTIGITLQNFIKNNVTPDVLIALIYNQDSELFQTNFLQPLTRFFTNLNDFLKSQNFDDFQSKALLNNSKFVAATSITFLEPFSNSSDSLEVCKAIVSID